MVKSPENQEEDSFKLKFINVGGMRTAEFATEQAMKEIVHFSQISRKGFGYVRLAINEQNPDKFEEYRAKLVKYEEIADRVEYEIAGFLNSLSRQELSEDTISEVRMMYKIIGELESLGDSGEAISRILSQKNAHGKTFSPESITKLNRMVDLVDKAYEVMIGNLSGDIMKMDNISTAYDAEDSINNMRNNLRDEEIMLIEQQGDNYQTSVWYMDIISHLEQMGDFMINVSESLLKFRNSLK